jgi:hypothetical protein
MPHVLHTTPGRQRGAAAVEFALIAVAFLTLLFGIIEFGRLFFNINSVQEITRRAAREQVVRWVSAADQDTVQRLAVLQPASSGTVYFPGAIDITNAQVQLGFYHTYDDAVNGNNPISYGSGSAPADNVSNCLLSSTDPNYLNCIRFVRAELVNADGTPVNFRVLVPFMPSNVFPLPGSMVIMPAESLGLAINI